MLLNGSRVTQHYVSVTPVVITSLNFCLGSVMSKEKEHFGFTSVTLHAVLKRHSKLRVGFTVETSSAKESDTQTAVFLQSLPHTLRRAYCSLTVDTRVKVI